MGYVDPHISDADFIKSHAVLSKRQGRKDYAEALSDNGFDAAVIRTKRPTRPKVRSGFLRPPQMSRSGALPPHIKSRLARAEADGRIEIQRNDYGEIEAYRDLHADD